MLGAGYPLRRRLVKAAVTLLAIGAGFYFLLLAVLFFQQTRLLFPGAGEAPLLPQTDRLVLATIAGEQLRGVHIRPAPVEHSDGSLVLGFGGNAWNAEAVASTLHDLYPRSDVVAFHFRGYPPSTGRPSAAALLEDAPLILDYVATRFPRRRIVVVGFSVGAAAAARLASNKRLAGAILVTPFDSLRTVAQSHFPWAPVGLLLRNHLDPIDDVRHARSPIAIVAAEQDEIIPSSSTEALRQTTSNLVYQRVIPACDHNSIYRHPQFGDAMHEAFSAVTGHWSAS